MWPWVERNSRNVPGRDGKIETREKVPQGSASQRSAAQRGTAERSAVLRGAVRRWAGDDRDTTLYAVLEDPRAVEQFAATKEEHDKVHQGQRSQAGKFWTDPRFGASAAGVLEAATIDKNLAAEQIM